MTITSDVVKRSVRIRFQIISKLISKKQFEMQIFISFAKNRQERDERKHENAKSRSNQEFMKELKLASLRAEVDQQRG